MSSDDTSFDVRVWSIQQRHGKRGASYGVRWSVARRPKRRTFATAKLADGFRAELLAAVRNGTPFELDSGLPRVLAHERGSVTWLAHARSYAAAKWPYVSPNHRRGIAETLTDLTLELTTSPALNEYDVTPLRHLLLRRAFVPTS